jgi:hypothetical protein
VRAPWRVRVREWVCGRFGHRPRTDEWQTTVCKRCRRLLGGPLRPYRPEVDGRSVRVQLRCVRGWYLINRDIKDWNLSRRAALWDALKMWRDVFTRDRGVQS